MDIPTTMTTTATADTVDNTADKNKISTASTPINPPSTPTDDDDRKFCHTNSLDFINTNNSKPPKPRGISISTMYRTRSRSIETAFIQNNRNKSKISTIRKFSHGNDRVHNGDDGSSVNEASSVPR